MAAKQENGRDEKPECTGVVGVGCSSSRSSSNIGSHVIATKLYLHPPQTKYRTVSRNLAGNDHDIKTSP